LRNNEYHSLTRRGQLILHQRIHQNLYVFPVSTPQFKKTRI